MNKEKPEDPKGKPIKPETIKDLTKFLREHPEIEQYHIPALEHKRIADLMKSSSAYEIPMLAITIHNPFFDLTIWHKSAGDLMTTWRRVPRRKRTRRASKR